MKIPVILLNYNSTADCQKCISFLLQQEGIELEIIVVDNCSTTDNRNAIETLCKDTGCTFIANDKNFGYNAGNNIGLRYASSKGYEYALIANPDMEFPHKGYIKNLAEIISKDEKSAVVASDIITPKGIHQNPMKPEDNWKSSFGWFSGLFKQQTKDTYSFIDNWQESHECSKVSGCCFLIRLSFLKGIDFFDENVFLYCEEAILSKQVERTRMKMYYASNLQAIHNHQPSSKGNPVVRFKHWLNSRVYYIKTYSNDSWIGKQIAILNMHIYVGIMIIAFKIRR